MARAKKPLDFDPFLKEWPFVPGEINTRLITAKDGRQVLQMRVDMGLLQMEVVHRPDGARPGDFDTYYDYLMHLAARGKGAFSLTTDHFLEIDREFLQYYHRRTCWIQLKRFPQAVEDANHTLALMDFVRTHCEHEDWVQAHEQYRPFVLFQRAQALCQHALEQAEPEAALDHAQTGMEAIRAAETVLNEAGGYDSDEFIPRLQRLANSIRKHFSLAGSLESQLAEAVALEEYERAAELRDEIARRQQSR